MSIEGTKILTWEGRTQLHLHTSYCSGSLRVMLQQHITIVNQWYLRRVGQHRGELHCQPDSSQDMLKNFFSALLALASCE